MIFYVHFRLLGADLMSMGSAPQRFHFVANDDFGNILRHGGDDDQFFEDLFQVRIVIRFLC